MEVNKYIYDFELSNGDDRYIFRFKEPNRDEKSKLSIFYSKTLFDLLKQGMPSVNMMDKLYADNVNGILSEEEHKEYSKLQNSLVECQKELEEIGDNKKEEDRRITVIEKLNKTRTRINELQMQKESIYSNTAEIFSRNRVIEKLVLDLLYYRSVNSKEFIPFFGDGSYEDKLDDFDKKSNSDEFFQEAISTSFAAATLYWLHGVDDKKRINQILNGINEEEEEEAGEDSSEEIKDPSDDINEKVEEKDEVKRGRPAKKVVRKK